MHFRAHRFGQFHHRLERCQVLGRNVGRRQFVEVLRTDTEHQLAALVRGDPALVEMIGQRQFPSVEDGDEAVAPALNGRGQHVHLRRADEAGDEHVDGTVVKVLRRIDLLDVPVLHDDDPVRHGHGFDLVVSDVDEGGIEALVQLGDFRAHRAAQLGVEIGQRLVEEENGRVAHHGAAERDALALPTRKRFRLAVQEMGNVEDLGRILHLLVDEITRHFAQLQAESHVLVDGHMRVERIILENHRDIPILRGDVVHDVAADLQFSSRDLLEAGDHPERRRFAATGGADQDDEFLIGNFQIDIVDDGERAVGFVQLFKRNAGHRVLLTSPIGRPAARKARQSFHVIIISPGDALIDAFAAAGVEGRFLRIGGVQHQAIGDRGVLDRIVIGEALHHAPRQRPVALGGIGVDEIGHLKQAASGDRSRGTVARLAVAIGKDEIPIGHHVGRQPVEIEGEQPVEGLAIFLDPLVAVGDRHARDAPGLSSRPETVVPVALFGGAAHRRAGDRVHVESVVGGIVKPHRMGERRAGMGERDLTVFRIAGLAAGPVEKRQVQQAIDDVAVFLRSALAAPGLDELADRLEALDQLVGGQDRRLAAVLVPDEFPGGDAGGRIEKAHVVVIGLDAVDDPMQEGLDLDLRGMAEHRIAAMLEGEP
ncbi:hypothetical protein RHECNPAF_73009 [Rhizobium etli CNPAF512]|nr:hypothetical protein RHECNPAF_73009 [Rhizobium etli CNPAF512]